MYIVENVVIFTCGGLSKLGLAPGLILGMGPVATLESTRQKEMMRKMEESLLLSVLSS